MGKIRVLLCFAVSLICIVLVIKRVDINELPHLFVHIHYLWLLIGAFMCVLKMWFTALRARYLLNCDSRFFLVDSFHFYAIGTMINMIVPLRVGDLTRARLIAKSTHISQTKVLATIASEHIFDFLTLFSLLTVSCIFYSYNWSRNVIFMLVVTLMSVLVFLAILFFVKINRKKIELLACKIIPKRAFFIYEMFVTFSMGLFQLDKKNFLRVFVATLGVWAFQGLWIYALFKASGSIMEINFELVLIIMVVVGMVAMIPSSPGFIGTFHLMVMLALTQLGFSQPVALSYAILSHAHGIIVAILIGLCSFWKINMRASKEMFA